MKRALRIAVIAEHSRAFTREMLAGIASAAQERDEWALELVDPAAFGHIDLSGYDAFIARILSDADANRLADTGKPVVDVFGRSDRLEFPCRSSRPREFPRDPPARPIRLSPSGSPTRWSSFTDPSRRT